METKLATIPRVVMTGAFGPKEYGILLTDQRMIFALESSSKAGLAGALAGPIGAAIATAAALGRSTGQEVSYENVNPDELAKDEKSVVVPYNGIDSLIVERAFGSYRILIRCAAPEGKRRKLAAMIAPPPATVEANRARGVTPKETAADDARTVQSLLQQAMPTFAAAKASWRL